MFFSSLPCPNCTWPFPGLFAQIFEDCTPKHTHHPPWCHLTVSWTFSHILQHLRHRATIFYCYLSYAVVLGDCQYWSPSSSSPFTLGPFISILLQTLTSMAKPLTSSSLRSFLLLIPEYWNVPFDHNIFSFALFLSFTPYPLYTLVVGSWLRLHLPSAWQASAELRW